MQHNPDVRAHGRGTRIPNRMPEELTELIADVLLASQQGDEDHPAYREEQISRKQRRAAQAEEHFLMSLWTQRSLELMLDDDRTWTSALTERQKAVCDMIEEGVSVAEVSRRLGVARTTVVRLLRQAAYRASVSECAYRGLSEVYHREVHRYLYRKPQHCATKPCQKLGYCKFAGIHLNPGVIERSEKR